MKLAWIALWSCVGILLAGALFVGSVVYLFWGWERADYIPGQRLVDAKSGFAIEVGILSNLSSYCTVLNVFTDQRTEHTDLEANNRKTVFFTCSIDSVVSTNLSFDDGCYVLTFGRHVPGHFTPLWKDDAGRHDICFRLNSPTTN